MARSRARCSLCRLRRIDYTCLGFRGGFGPTKAPLFQGTTDRSIAAGPSDNLLSTTFLPGQGIAAEERWG